MVYSVIERMKRDSLTLSTAESCTGGLLADRITDVPGSSAVLMAGMVAYSNEAKINILNVNRDTIVKHGAVSEEVAKEMAAGIRRVAASDIGIGITGIAGPSGGSPEKPVGLVFVAMDFDGRIGSNRLKLGGHRREIKEKTVDAALAALSGLLDKREF